MSQGSTPFAWGNALDEFALFRTLSPEQRLKAFRAMVRQDLTRGQMLVAQGDPSDALFMVLHGALAVRRAGELEPLAELRAGELVGEIGFFGNIPRTTDVIAMLPGRALDAPEVADWLNKLEQTAPLVVYFGGREASPWARKAIRQADMVVFACRGDAPSAPLTELETVACSVHPCSARRLVR